MINIKKIVFIAVGIMVLVLGFYGLELLNYKKTIKEIKIENVDLSTISDGKYTGSCDASYIAAEVSVTVKDHKITDISLLKHKNERGKPAEVIPQKVVETQNLKVDTISGATNSSKVILKAIENALISGKP